MTVRVSMSLHAVFIPSALHPACSPGLSCPAPACAASLAAVALKPLVTTHHVQHQIGQAYAGDNT